jgi:hypothetical protein
VGPVTARERAGYWIWAIVALVVAVPEVWALAARTVPWPTISGTVGHLEDLWHPTAVLVVAAIVVAAALAAGYGVVAQAPVPPAPESWWPYAYLAAAAALTAAGGLLAAQLADGRFVVGYAIYGLIGVFFFAVPALLGSLVAMPFPSLFATLRDLERRVPVVALLVLAGLVVLLIHLALYPWPDVAHHAPAPASP